MASAPPSKFNLLQIGRLFARRSQEPGWPRRYFTARFTRIYIPYLPIGIAMAVAYLALPDLSRADREWSWFSTMTLLPSEHRPALHVAWALQHEILFYAVAFVFLRYRFFVAGSLAWAAAIVGWNLAFGLSTSVFFKPMNVDFLFGAAAAWCAMNDRMRADRWLIAGALALLILYFAMGIDESPVVGLAIAAAMLPLVRFERRRDLRLPAPLLELGNASFAIFLVHWPLVAMAGRLLAPTGIAWPLSISLLLVASVLAGAAYHLAFERPVLRLLRRPEGTGGVKAR